MFQHLLVPLDGSRLAEAVLPPARYLAERYHARVTLIHLVEQNAPSQVHGERHLRNEQEADAYLKEVAQRAFPSGVQVDFHVHASEIRDVARSLVAHADEFANDLIIMCAHGRSGIRGWMMGGIAQQVVAQGTKPVLLIPPINPGQPPVSFACGTVVIALDDDPEHAQALFPALTLARGCGSTVHIVMVVPTVQTLPSADSFVGRLLPTTAAVLLDLTEQNAADYLKSQIEQIRQSEVPVTGGIYRGDPATVIVETAKQVRADVIVMGTHGRIGLGAFWAESVASKVSSRSQIPLLLVPVISGETAP